MRRLACHAAVVACLAALFAIVMTGCSSCPQLDPHETLHCEGKLPAIATVHPR